MMAFLEVNMALVFLALNRLELGENHTDLPPLACRNPGLVPEGIHIHLDSLVVPDKMTQLELEVSHTHPHALQGPGVTHTHHYSQAHYSWVLVCDN